MLLFVGGLVSNDPLHSNEIWVFDPMTVTFTISTVTLPCKIQFWKNVHLFNLSTNTKGPSFLPIILWITWVGSFYLVGKSESGVDNNQAIAITVLQGDGIKVEVLEESLKANKHAMSTFVYNYNEATILPGKMSLAISVQMFFIKICSLLKTTTDVQLLSRSRSCQGIHAWNSDIVSYIVLMPKY